MHVLQDIAAREGLENTHGAVQIPPSWSHDALARQLGVCRETVTRGLAELARAGVIERDRRRIVVLLRHDAHADATGSGDRRVERQSPRLEHEAKQDRRPTRADVGLREIEPAVRGANNDEAIVLKLVGSLHREQLSNRERIATIEGLAATGLGVREISRRTGFNPSTISRWLRINTRQELKLALEDGRLDLARAVILVEAPAAELTDLIDKAPRLSTTCLRRQVASLRGGEREAANEPGDRRRLTQALLSLRAVEATNEADLLQRIRREVERLSDASRPHTWPTTSIVEGARAV
jgi:hypothetical protein